MPTNHWSWQSVMTHLVNSDKLYPLRDKIDALEAAHNDAMKPAKLRQDAKFVAFNARREELDKEVHAAIVEFNRADHKHREEVLNPQVRKLLLEVLAEVK